MKNKKDNTGAARFRANKTGSPDSAQIRDQAEQKARAIKPPALEAMTREETQHMFIEMQVKQLEMELKVDQLENRLEEAYDQATLFKTFSENMLDMILLTDIEGKIKFIGNSVEVLGYEPDSLFGKNVIDFVHPEDQPHVSEAYQKLVASATPRRIEYRCRCKDGSYLWIETRGAIVKENNNTQGIVFNSRDITKRKQAEEAFRESENKFYLLTEEAPVSIMHFDKNGIVKFVNKWHIDVFAKGLLGKDFFINKKITDLPGIKSAGIGPELEKIFKGETVVIDQVHIPEFAVGHEGYQCMRGVPFFYNGEISGGILIRDDVTDRKHAEENLCYQKQLLETIVNGTCDVLAIQYPDHTIERYNQAGYDLFGLTPEEVNGRKCFELIGRDRRCSPCATQQVLQCKKPVNIEKYVPELGAYFDCRSAPVMDENGDIIRIVEHLRDITERKQSEKEQERLQAQLNQARRMESVGRLAGGVAHDFNNKLTIINGYAEMAIDMMDPSDPLRKTIQEIYTAGNQSADIVRQLLAFARKQTINPVLIDLNDTISSMLKMLQRLIGENIGLAWHPGKNLYRAKIDPSQVDQIMANLSLNARDAISDVGKLTIETKNTIVDADFCKTNPEAIPGRYIVLIVSDDGCGMEKEIKDQLFEPFFTTKEVGKGTGLGLPTVYGIVKQNNGFIRVYSEPGKGTIFKLYFPSSEAEKSSAYAAKEAIEQMPTGTETVLLVEDESEILHMGRGMLEKLGYTLLTAEKPDAALRLAEEYEGKIHILITDVIMPGMNGRDLSAKLSDCSPGLKTIYISGYTENFIAHHGGIDEGVQFIQKPFSLRDLAVKVREVLEQE